MKKLRFLLLVLAISAALNAGTMEITGLPEVVDTSSDPVVLLADIVSNGQRSNDSIYIWTYTGGTLDIATATNHVVPGEIYDDSLFEWLEAYVDTTNVSSPIIWADIAIPAVPQPPIIGDIVTDLGLTIAQGYQGTLEVKVLTESPVGRIYTGVIQDVVTIQCIPEPATIAILALGTLCLRRRK